MNEYGSLPRTPPDSYSQERETPTVEGVQNVSIEALKSAFANPERVIGESRQSQAQPGAIVSMGRPFNGYQGSPADISQRDRDDQFCADAHELMRIVEESGLPDVATVKELNHARAHKLKIPFLDEEVDTAVAFIVFSIANVVIVLYVVSLLNSIRVLFERNSEIPGVLDLVLLYPSKIATALSVGWLLLPVIATLLLVVTFRAPARHLPELALSVGFALTLLVLIQMAVKQAAAIRRLWAKSQCGATSEAAVSKGVDT
jgi:hypothetical protein